MEWFLHLNYNHSKRALPRPKNSSRIVCHPRMRENLSYIHILNTASVSNVCQATIIKKISKQILSSKNAWKFKYTYGIPLLLSPDMKAIILYIWPYAVSINKYCWAFYNLAVPYTPKTIVQMDPKMWNILMPHSDWSLKVNMPNKTLTGTGELRLEICNLSSSVSSICKTGPALISLEFERMSWTCASSYLPGWFRSTIPSSESKH